MMLLADIDHFEEVNDTYGHLFGGKVIRTVADILKSNVKGMDTAARFGGEALDLSKSQGRNRVTMSAQ